MFAIERVRIIKHRLNDKGQVQVQTLSSELGVSEVTIRRDLERLESEGFLTRTHGGAIINRQETDQPKDIPAGIPGPDKTAYEGIVSIALQMIKDGDVIMITNGEIGRVLASRLDKRSNLTILTNDIICAAILNNQKANRTILLGGSLIQDDMAVYGSMTLSNLANFYVNKLFIEADGISSDLQLSVNCQEKADLFREAKKLSNETIVLCPADHFSRKTFFRLGGLEFAQHIISDTELDESVKSRIFSANIPLYTSVAAFEGSA